MTPGPMSLRLISLALIVFVSANVPVGWAQQSRQTSAAESRSAEAAVDLRVGIISYDKPEDKIRDYRAVFEELSQQGEDSINYKPRFAVGTYADVLDWITRGLIDIAVLSPNAFAETTAWKRKSSGPTEADNEPDCIYLATEGKAPAAQDAWVNSALKTTDPGKGRFEYNSICIVAANSEIRTFDDLRERAKEDKVQFVFGDPLSASGTIWPMNFLRANHIDFRKHMEYSFGHSDSVTMILQEADNPPAPGTRTKVAFVADLAILDPQRDEPVDKRHQLRPVADTKTIKGLTDALLPMEVWVARKDFDKSIGGALPPGTQKKSDKFRAALLAHMARKKSVEDKQEPQGQGEAKPKKRNAVDPPIRDFIFHDELALENRIIPLYAWAQQIKGLLAQPVDARLEGDYSKDEAAKTPGTKFPVRFQDVVSLIRHYNRIHGDVSKARLAVVLSGGGAKCAYQAGAIERIEKALTDLSPPGTPAASDVDIDLVVGTSGGALNAVPIAVGISRNSGARPPLADTWTELNALQIIRPPRPVAICLGFCYAFLFFIGIRGLVRLIRSRTTRWSGHSKWVRLLGCLFIVIPALGFVLFYFPGLLQILLQFDSHLLFYFLLAVSCGIFVAAPLCVIWGFLVLANAHKRHDGNVAGSPFYRRLLLKLVRWSDPQHPIPFLNLALIGMILVGIALVFALAHGGGLFLGDPLEKVVIRQYAKLFAGKSQEDLRANGGKGIGKAIRDWPDRKRDLVITGSSLTQDSRGSKYFYLPGVGRANKAEPPSYGTHGVEIGTDCDIDRLVDIALGSGTIFPFFPSHEVKENSDRNQDGKRRYPLKTLDLIDGGFAHNSPIEAATRWSATHIILLDASPETTDRGRPKSAFGSNILKAIGYLFDQAQTADVNAQEEAAVFTLRPSLKPKPQITILDFGPGFVEDALTRGRSDATAWSFVRQPAKPLFWEAQVAPRP